MSAAPPLAFPVRIPFVEALGFELWQAADGRSELRMDIARTHLNHRDVAHGGVLMTLLDVAMAQAARTLHRPGEAVGPAVVTIEMKTTFVRPAAGRLAARGHVLHRTTATAFCEASVFDDAGRLCAHSTGTFKYVRALAHAPETGTTAARNPS